MDKSGWNRGGVYRPQLQGWRCGSQSVIVEPPVLAAEILFARAAGFPRDDQRNAAKAIGVGLCEDARHATGANPWGSPES